MPSAVSTEHNSTASLSNIIPATVMPLVSPTALLSAHLQQDPPVRPSGRSPDQAQQIGLNTGSLTHTNGSSVVKIGATTVVCGVRAEILLVSEIPSYSDPKTDVTRNHNDNDKSLSSPEQHTPISLYGLVVPNLELSTGCSPLHPANAAPGTQAQSLTQRLYTLLLTTHLVSESDLAIDYVAPPETDTGLDPDDPAYISFGGEPETKAFWVLYVDMWCISHGGEAGVFDAAWLSLYAALRDVVLPHAWWAADEKVVLCDPDVRRGTRLELAGCPVPLGFAAMGKEENDAKSWVLVDPDAFEEQCCAESGCVVVDLSATQKTGKIVRLEKSGGGAVGMSELSELVGHAEKKWKQWQAILAETPVRQLTSG